MGYWGITERESDAGLDLLAVIADTQLKPAGYTVFNVEEALELVKAGCLDRIRQRHSIFVNIKWQNRQYLFRYFRGQTVNTTVRKHSREQEPMW